jgi:VWFA-related protein
MKAKKVLVLVIAITALAALAAGRPAEEPRKFLILIDYRHNDLPGVSLAKDAALYFLGTEVRDEDEVALMLFSDVRNFQVIEEFTTDHDKVRRGLRAMIDVPGPAGIDGSGMALMTEPLPPQGPPGAAPAEGSGESPVRESAPAMRNASPLFANSAVSRVSPMRDRVYLDQMKDLAEFLTEIPGRKNIIYFSLGFPAFRYQDDTTFREKFDAMAAGFSAAQAPVYTVNTLGHRQDSLAVAAKVDFLLGKFAGLSGGRYYGHIEKYKEIAKDLGKIAGS